MNEYLTEFGVIRTSFHYPPIPIRSMDFAATHDDYEEGDPIGWGRTEPEAIDDLIEQLEERK